ncbi:MAG TPA: hypothetical protein VFR02_00770 [bacterium]|nr:hypothetical protein [bacterium]
MKSNPRTGSLFAALFTGLLLLTPARLLADEPTQFLYGRTYFGLLGTSASMDGTGFGTATLLASQPYEATLVPSISQNFGWGAFLGRREGAFAAEVSFWQSVHQASWDGSYPVSWSGATPYGQTLKGSATLNMVNVDFKMYFFTEQSLQPFVGLGVDVPWLETQDTSANGASVGNAVFEGVGFDLGLGAEYYFDTTFSLVAGFYEKWTGFGQYKGVNNVDEQIQNASGHPSSFTANGLDFYIGTTVGFI